MIFKRFEHFDLGDIHTHTHTYINKHIRICRCPSGISPPSAEISKYV